MLKAARDTAEDGRMTDAVLTEQIVALGQKLADIQERLAAVRNEVRSLRVDLRERA
jgi:hypothetical protein